MKRRVLSKTTPFHVKKKNTRNDTVPLSSSPERAAGDERKVLFFLASLSRHMPAKTDPPCTLMMEKTKGAAPCQPHPLASQPGVVAGQQSPAPQALL
jgi:hypothetical protein